MRRSCLLLLFAALLSGVPALTQSIPAQPSISTVTLGHSLVPLYGPWKFHIGDNPQWANPNVDDSTWETVDLAPKTGSIDPNAGLQGFVPGWTAKGHPGYSGYAWYRMRVRLTGADGLLALLAPLNVDDSYQFFANGRLIGSFGDFSGSVPTIYSTRPLMFALPASVLRGEASRDNTVDLAFRFYMAPRTLTQLGGPGGMHDAPAIGLADAVTRAWSVAGDDDLRGFSSVLASAFLYLGFTLLILMLYVFDRTETIALWPLGACAVAALFYFLLFSSGFTFLIAQLQYSLISVVLIRVFSCLWLITFLAYFGLQAMKWIRNAIFAVFLWGTATELLFQVLTLGGPRVPKSVFNAFLVNTFAMDAAIVLLMALIAYFGIRRSQRTDWMLLLAMIFYGIPTLQLVLRALHIRTTWFPFGIDLQLVLLADIASLFCFSFVLLRHFRASQRRQQAMVEDVKQAQEVQQVLIPERLPQVPGLAIESEYLPAREVGGDFFQILPHTSDGSVLIVAGDVTGKGLQAGMLVALIVGAIRTAVEKSFDPLEVLQSLNRRLCDRGNAHATCLALRIAADGSATLANAGHMPPYINGKELPMEGAMPLGLSFTAQFPIMRFQLAADDHLMLLSDGVAEAMDEQGRLFGFDRIQTLLAQPVTAAEIASAAQKFGQQDDISILSITRTAVLEEALV